MKCVVHWARIDHKVLRAIITPRCRKPWSWQASRTISALNCRRSASAVSGLLGEVGQQSAGHLPLEHHGMANGGFSILPTGTTDTEPTYELRQSGRAALLYKIFCC